MKRLLFLIFILLCLALLIVRFNKISMTVPTVSVVMPVYNREAFVSRAIDSILAQTYADFEFIIVDDGSTDKTIDILNKYASTEPRIRVLRNQQNCGISCSRNKGMDAARGKYIAVMDSDDAALPIRLEKLVAVMEENPTFDAVAGQLSAIEKDIKPKWLENPTQYGLKNKPAEMQFNLMFTNNFWNSCSLIRRQFVVDHQIRYNQNYIAAGDYEFWKQMLIQGGKLAKIGDVVTQIRFHNSNSEAYYKATVNNSLAIKKELMERFFTPEETDIKWSYHRPEQCYILQKIEQANLTKKTLKQEDIEAYKVNVCPPPQEKSIYLRHPSWSGYLVLKDNNQAFRYPQKIAAKVQWKGPDVTINWDRYPAQKFALQKDGSYLFVDKAIRREKVSHPSWQDTLVFKENHRVCRSAVKDCARVLKETSNELIVKWDNYGTETFRLNPKTYTFDYINVL